MYQAAQNRYQVIPYRRCGASGLMLPAVSLGLWHNFGDTAPYENMRALCRTAFDHGITHFDLANNYGPEPGAAERNFGKILRDDLGVYRDELIISTKAGYLMWDGPYGDWGSRKYLLASLDRSLQRMGLDYVDIFYHHRMDPNTPLEETMGALAQAVRSGKALYAGLSNYDGPTLEKAAAILDELHVPFVINQNRYSIFDRTIEHNGLKDTAAKLHKGIITFSPLAQGLLTDRYLHGIHADSRVQTDGLTEDGVADRADQEHRETEGRDEAGDPVPLDGLDHRVGGRDADQHEHEEEQHQDRAGVDDDLHDEQEGRVEGGVEAGQRQHHHRQRQGRVHRLAAEHHPQGAQHRDRRQDPEGNRLGGHEWDEVDHLLAPP